MTPNQANPGRFKAMHSQRPRMRLPRPSCHPSIDWRWGLGLGLFAARFAPTTQALLRSFQDLYFGCFPDVAAGHFPISTSFMLSVFTSVA